MKKIFFGAAVATMMFASCQNDMIESVEQQGRMFTLEVNQGGSRTALDGLQTVWSKGDQIYVTSEDGQTTGVLTLIGEGGEAGGKFSGFVFGNGELKYSVYPVPTKPVDLGKANAERLDAPMTGTISGGATTFNHACGFVRLNLLGIDNDDKVNIAGGQVGSVLEYDLATNTWKKKTVASKITVVEAEDAETFYVPVYVDPTTTAPIDLTITINNETEGDKMTVTPQASKVNAEVPNFVVTEDGIKDIATTDPSELGDNYIYVEVGDDVKAKIEGAKEGSYIVLKSGIHNLTTQINIRKSLTIIGESETEIVGGYTPGYPNQDKQTRAFYFYCENAESLVLKNLTFISDKNDRVTELWIRQDVNGPVKETNVLLEKVITGMAIIDNRYNDGHTINVELIECTIQQFTVDAWNPDPVYGNVSFSNLSYDEKSVVNVNIQKGVAFENITINGKNPTRTGIQ